MGYTPVILRPITEFGNMTREEKIRACYQHACVKHMNGESMTNASLRERFGLKTTMSSIVSKIIKDAINAGMVKALDPNTAPKHISYVPFWA